MTGLRIVAMIVIAFLATPGYAADCDLADLDEAKALALKAAELLEREGPKNALVKFMEPGPFIDRDLYVFVLDMEGTLWASGAFPEGIGSNAWEAQDSGGNFFVQEMIHIAADKGEGWVEYDFFNPCTGERSPKASYVKRVGPLIVGVGAYGTVSA
jgi:signal transduction histidine kinase